MRVRHSLLLALLVSSSAIAADEDMPSMDFLEYLGGFEIEVDGELVSPTELELIAENVSGEETDHE